MQSTKSEIVIIGMLLLTSICVAIISLHFGRFTIAINDIFLLLKSFFDKNTLYPETVKTVILNIRLPRILAAFLVGGTLSLTGAAYQGMFRNPMVSPSILGVSAGAGFGAALGILLALQGFWIQTLSFLFGIGAVLVVYSLSLVTGRKYDKNLTLILSGMIITAVFTALISILKIVADPNNTLPAIEYWLMGGLSGVQLGNLQYIAILSFAGLLFLSLSGWKLDILSFGDEEAKSMGINVRRLRFTVIIIATLLTASAVSISGIIGWVGLLVPHIARMLIGPKNVVLLPASFLIGAIFLLIVDDFSRCISSIEIPLGITTALIGAPFFIFILLKTSKKV